MMASMGPSFPPHPAAGMQQHPGAPTHPIGAPGMAHNPSQPGAQPQGIPHQLAPHMAVSAPGGQMNAGPLVGGMPPGAGGPNAHAMSHLNPAQPQIFQAQHPNMGAFAPNQQQVIQMQQQQRLQQVQQQQQHAQRLMQQAYGQMGGQMGGQMSGIPLSLNMNLLPAQAAQVAAMRARQQQNPQAQAMITQQLALQQQQMSANNQMAQQGGNPNHLQLNPQFQGLQQAQLQAVQMQQLQQMQAAQAHAAQAHQAQLQAQAQAQAQGQGPQQQQNQQQQPGQPQPQNGGQQQGPNGPAGNFQGQNQGPGPQGNQHQPPPHQQQGPTPAQQQQAHQAQLQSQHAMASSLAAHHQMLQRHRDLKSQCLLKLLLFSEQLSGFSKGSKASKDDTQYWDNFVRNFFSETGSFRYTIPNTDENEHAEKQYEVTFPALPRFFHTHFDSGVKNIQLVIDRPFSDRPAEDGRHLVETQRASMVYWFEGGSHVVATGNLRAQFDRLLRLELLEFATTSHEEFVSRKLVIEAAKPAHNWVKEWNKVNAQPDSKQSPEMSKKGKSRLMKSPQNPPPDLDLPHSVVKQNVGVTEAVHQFLEMVDIMGQMSPLFQYYHAHPGLAPYSALEQYVGQLNASAQQQQQQQQQSMNMAMSMNMANGQAPMQGGGVQGGPRTPGFGQFQMGQSPAQVHQMLPQSPHIGGSPAPGGATGGGNGGGGGQMQAPPMQLQASQQGTTNSSGPSANTSPSQQNNTNKRRRPSGVKNEDDNGGGPASAPTPVPVGTPQLNGVQGGPAKTKPATPRMTKRAKGNPA